MKAAIFHDPGHLECRADVQRPTNEPGHVVIAVEACGICGSDLHLYRTNAHRGPSLLQVTAAGQEVPGHEYSGTIVEVGPGVAGWNVGDRVVGVTGGGGFAEFVSVPVNPYQLVRIPDAVSYDEAATTEPMADALQMIRLAELKPDENVVVFGVGIVGLGVIQALRALNVPIGHLIAIDVSAPRLSVARELGATAVINPRETDVFQATGDVCGRMRPVFGPFDFPDVAVVFDCAGYLKHMKGPPPLQLAINMLRPSGGRIICFGAYEGDVTLDLTYLIEKQIRIIGSLGYAPNELVKALELMETGKVDRLRLLSHHFPLEDITAAFETQGIGQAIKVLVHPK